MEGSIKTSYQVGDVPDFSKLKIDLFNKHDTKLDTVYYNSSDSRFTISDINTSSATTGKFFVQYLASNPNQTFTDSIGYTVTAKETPAEDLTLVSYIKIVKGSIITDYKVGDTPDYSSLQIKTYNKHDTELATFTYSSSQAAFEISSIVTSSAGTRTFFVKFTASNPASSFTDSISYTVSVNQDKVVAGIQIRDGFQTVYSKGEVPSYDSLYINTVNSAKQVLGILSYKDNTSTIALTNAIDTSVDTTTGVFKVTYTPDASHSFTAQISYTVKKVSYLTNWSSNARWTTFSNANKNVNATMDGRETFIAGTTFKIGTLNALNLCPIVQEYDAINDDVATHTNLVPENTTIILTKGNSETALNLNEYFETADLALLKKDGDVNFKDDVAEGSYKLTFRYKDGTTQSFPDIVYSFDLLHAYNITNSAQLMVINNGLSTADSSSGYNAASATEYNQKITDFKTSNNLPTDVYDKFILQNDVDVSLSAIPSYFVWQKDEPTTDTVEGSLKDWTYFYARTLTADHPTFEFYGNLNKITMTNLPLIKSDATSNKTDEHSTPINNGTIHDSTLPFETHASLFYTNGASDIEKESNGTYRTLFQDIAFYGNQGVDGNAKWQTQGGVILDKSSNYTVFKNMNANHFFTSVVNNGYAGYTALGAAKIAIRDPKLWVIDSRLHDTYSTMIFNYSASSTYSIHSELMNAGGPLVINQSASFKNTPVQADDDPTTTTKNAYEGTWFRADDTSHLENYVTGQGGWFNIYGAESTLATLGVISKLFEGTFGVSFKPTIGGVGRYNMVAVNMGIKSTLAGSDPAFYGGASLQGTASSTATYWDNNPNNWPSVSSGVSYLDYGDKNKVADYTNSGADIEGSMKKYDFMNNYLCQAMPGTDTKNGVTTYSRAPIFKTHGTTGDQFIFGSIDLTTFANSKLYNTHNLYAYSQGTLVDPASFTTEETANITGSSYIGIYYDVTNTVAPVALADYPGSSAFGLVLGLSKVSA